MTTSTAHLFEGQHVWRVAADCPAVPARLSNKRQLMRLCARIGFNPPAILKPI